MMALKDYMVKKGGVQPPTGHAAVDRVLEPSCYELANMNEEHWLVLRYHI